MSNIDDCLDRYPPTTTCRTTAGQKTYTSWWRHSLSLLARELSVDIIIIIKFFSINIIRIEFCASLTRIMWSASVTIEDLTRPLLEEREIMFRK